MIDKIITGRYLVSSISNTPCIYNNGQGAGQVRYNISYQRHEVSDGISWYTAQCPTTISLTPEAQDVIDWAQKKMYIESQVESLALTNPAVATALDNVTRAIKQLETTMILSQDHT